jgi:hypothetical protein
MVMKSFVGCLVIAAFLVFGASLPLSASGDATAITVRIQGERILFPDQPPVIDHDRVLVPMRRICESGYVQAKVQWNAGKQSATIYDQRGYRYRFTVGVNQYQIIDDQGNSRDLPLDAAPIIINGRCLIPLRALVESLEFYAKWLPEIQSVEIQDSLPAWRKLLSLVQWQEELALWQAETVNGKGECLPCLKKQRN